MNLCPKCGAYWQCDCEPQQPSTTELDGPYRTIKYGVGGIPTDLLPTGVTVEVSTAGQTDNVTISDETYTGDWIH